MSAEKKKRERDGERFWTPTRDNASVSAKICSGETEKRGRAREGGSWMWRGVGEWGEKSTMRHVYKNGTLLSQHVKRKSKYLAQGKRCIFFVCVNTLKTTFAFSVNCHKIFFVINEKAMERK